MALERIETMKFAGTAGVAGNAKKGTIVTTTANAGECDRAVANTGKPLGVLLSDVVVGDNVAIGIPRTGEVVKVVAGAAITLNSFCEVGDTSGRIISSTTTPTWTNNINNAACKYSVGFATEAAAAANDLISVRWLAQLIATA